MKKWTKKQLESVCKDFVIIAYQSTKSFSKSQLSTIYLTEHFVLCTLLIGYHTISDQQKLLCAIKELEPLYKLPF